MGVAISQLPAGSAPNGTEVFPAVQNGQTVKLPIAPIYNNFYVNSVTGVDNGTACTNALTPAKTIRHAVNIALSLAAGQQPQQINLTGAFTECVLVCKQPGLAGNANYDDSPLYFVGVDNAGTTTWNGDGSGDGTLVANAGATVAIRNLKISATGTSQQSCLYAQIGGYIGVYDGVIFGTANVQHMHAENTGSSVQIWDSYTIAGNATQHLAVSAGALIIYAPGLSTTVTLTGTPAFTFEFALAEYGGIIYVGNSVTFSGSATGRRFAVQGNGVINLDGQSTSLTYFPGNSAGLELSGGLYLGPVRNGTFTVTLTGVTTTVTGTASYIMGSGGQVNIDLPMLTGTSNSTGKTITGIPSWLQPASGKLFPAAVSDNGGSYVWGAANLSAGTITLTPTAGNIASGWTNSGAMEVNSLSLSYTLN